MPNGNLHDLRAVVVPGHFLLPMGGIGPLFRHDTGVSDWHTWRGSWHKSTGTAPTAIEAAAFLGRGSRGTDCALTEAMIRTLSFALVSILLAGCGTSSTSGAADMGGGAEVGSAGTGAGGAFAGSGNASAGSAGASTAAGGASAGSGGASTGGASAGSGGGGPLSCGSQTCGATQYCVNPCCGGNAPACMAKPDGGTCPAGTHQGCSNGVQCMNPSDCCQFDPCTPPPPYCSDKVPVGCLLEGRTCQLVCA